MTKQQENRRVRMTKRLMKDALLDLLEKKELDTISVTEICRTADVHRSTFYKYYTTPVDLLKEIEQDFLDRIPNPQNPVIHDPEKILAETTAFFDFVKKNDKTFRILFNDNVGVSFMTRLVELLCSQYIPIEEGDELSSCFIRQYIAHGTVGMMRKWIQSGYPVSNQEIAEKMYFLSKKVTG